ncbi:MAG: hypothetical protein MHPSP_003141 [Paramarteilia canceri]
MNPQHGAKAASVFLFLVAVRHNETLEDLPRLRVAAKDARQKLHVVKKMSKHVSNATQRFLDHLLRIIDANDESYGLCVSALLFENIAKNAGIECLNILEKAKNGVIFDYDKKAKVHDRTYNLIPDNSSLALVEKYFYNKNKKEIRSEPAQYMKSFNNPDSFTDIKESKDLDYNIDNGMEKNSKNSEIKIFNDEADKNVTQPTKSLFSELEPAFETGESENSDLSDAHTEKEISDSKLEYDADFEIFYI